MYNGGISLLEHLFQFIKREDKEPYNIEELLKGEQNERIERANVHFCERKKS